MKASVRHRYGGPEEITVDDVAVPEVGGTRVLVRVHAAGVDRGVWHLMAGLPYLVRAVYGVRRPRAATLGIDVAGVVEAVGERVVDLRPGDEVFGAGAGTFAEYVSARASKLARKPASVPF
jgi:NADPH:quinone reductase-like Zn-dependent oxidoreductase